MEGYVRALASLSRVGGASHAGTVSLPSMLDAHRYGTDAYVHLCRLGDGLEPTKVH